MSTEDLVQTPSAPAESLSDGSADGPCVANATGWKPISTAPRVPFKSLKVRLGVQFAPYHVTWTGNGWAPIEFLNGGPLPKEWFDESICARGDAQ